MSSKTLHHAGSSPEDVIAREEQSKKTNSGALRKCPRIANRIVFTPKLLVLSRYTLSSYICIFALEHWSVAHEIVLDNAARIWHCVALMHDVALPVAGLERRGSPTTHHWTTCASRGGRRGVGGSGYLSHTLNHASGIPSNITVSTHGVRAYYPVLWQ